VVPGWLTARPENTVPRGYSSGFVNVSNGCDNFCTFCVVPFARGSEVSRPKAEILTQVKGLVSRGITDITLCGQNVNSWGLSKDKKFSIRAGSDDKLPFAALLREVHSIPEVKSVSFISSNPFDFTSDMIEVLRLPKIANYLHIAVQSGNDDILKKMNRRHTVKEFTELLQRIRSRTC
jgi:tRNA-2-methylthio-N6-dimethylallyladenosine synthase